MGSVRKMSEAYVFGKILWHLQPCCLATNRLFLCVVAILQVEGPDFRW